MSHQPDDNLLDAARIRDLLVELGQRLNAQGLEARLFLVGGAALALAYDTRRITRDLDAVFEPKNEVYDAAGNMAQEHNLPPDWLNDAVKGLLPDKVSTQEGQGSFSTTGLHVGIASAEYLFAMKAQAARQEVDGSDLRELAAILGITTEDQALDIVEKYYQAARLRPNTHLILEDIFTTDEPG